MELRRLYFLQYQWMPFFVASAAIIYYLPYIIYQIFNTDVQNLKETIQKEKVGFSYFSQFLDGRLSFFKFFKIVFLY